MLASVSLQISLAIAVDVQLPDLATILHRVLPHGRAHGLAFPFDVARQTDVHREQLRHLDPHRGTFRLAIALTGALALVGFLLRDARTGPEEKAISISFSRFRTPSPAYVFRRRWKDRFQGSKRQSRTEC